MKKIQIFWQYLQLNSGRIFCCLVEDSSQTSKGEKNVCNCFCMNLFVDNFDAEFTKWTCQALPMEVSIMSFTDIGIKIVGLGSRGVYISREHYCTC